MQVNVPWLAPDSINFPDVSSALADPDGLLAFGGDLSPERLINAYRHGIFPWYSEDQPIMWWSPDPRMVLYPNKLKVSRSLKKNIHNKNYRVSFDQAFEHVIRACSDERDDQDGTWISEEMIAAYCQLHRLGHAHSVEVWQDETLIGGLYGVDSGRVFSGESMFSRATDASKIALYHLVHHLKAREDFKLIDCQVASEHLIRLGAENIARDEFIAILDA